MSEKTIQTLPKNDWGFSILDENELSAAHHFDEQIASMKKEYEKDIHDFYMIIQPLLNNLKANPNKEYLYWPDRAAIITDLDKKLNHIVFGEPDDAS